MQNRWNIGLDERSLGNKNLEASLVHEMGHLLGLDHPDVTRAGWGIAKQAMYPDPQEAERPLVFEPASVEVATLCAIYGERSTVLPRAKYLLVLSGLASLGLFVALMRWRTRGRA